MIASMAAPTSEDNSLVNINGSDEDDEDLLSLNPMTGTLSKWTNYIHGWQSRYFVLKDATLAYYKSEHELSSGCRGAISINKAVVTAHEFDECRFDIALNDNVWYLRAENSDERQKWMDAVEMLKSESGYGSQGDLRRCGSMLSLTSNRSLASTSSFKGRGLREKLAEMETFRDIVSRQIDTLQTYFDLCAEGTQPAIHDDTLKADDVDDYLEDKEGSCLTDIASGTVLLPSRIVAGQNGCHAVDFKGEALTFKATTAGILATLQHCVDLMQQREEAWRKRVEKEIERRKKWEDAYRQASTEAQRQKHVVVYGGPDFVEGPHSALNEDEWHDAVDAALERQEVEDKRLERLLSKDMERKLLMKPWCSVSLPRSHPLFSQVDDLTLEQLRYAVAGVEEGVWQLFAEDGEMKMYKRELEIDGLVCDPLKAVHAVQGCTAREFCHYFYEPEYKMDWDTTLEDMQLCERLSEDTVIIHQTHKRVWPASQRESLLWSHMRRVPELAGPDSYDLWIVCNHDTDHPSVPANGKMVRVGLTVAMVCQTVIAPRPDGQPLTRKELTCKIVYVAQVNPGGWAPASILRTVYKREYPKFLKRITQYILQKVEGLPIML